MGEAAKPILFEGIKAGCNVALCGRRGTSSHFHVSANVSKIVLCGRRNTFASLSEHDLQFSGHIQHCGDLRDVILRDCRRLAFRVFFANPVVRAADTHANSTLYPPHFPPHTLNLTTLLYILQFTLRTSHSKLLHSTPYTLQSALSTPHFTLYTSDSSLHTLHSTLHTLHSTLCTLHSTHSHFTADSTFYTPHSTLYTPHSTLYTPHVTLSTP